MGIETQIQLLRYRRTKIVATLGPSSQSPEMIGKLIEAGVNVFRQNFSHGAHEEHRALYGAIREQAKAAGRPVAVLADLSGPKIRVGKFPEGPIDLEEGHTVTVTVRDVPGEPGLIPSQYPALAEDVQKGDRILLDDGNLELQVDAIEGTEIACKVVVGGKLKNHKGINLPGVEVSAPSLTEKDRADAKLAMDLGVDLLALSFVRRGEDVQALRTLVERHPAEQIPAIIAKIEKPEALENISEILEIADGIMVARGDLGVELPPQAVPMAQEQLIHHARRRHKPVIVATQMLESMIGNPRPTRAEVSDVANAVRSGTDAVMLSGETAAGKYPLEAVQMMDKVARQTEAFLWEHGLFRFPKEEGGAETVMPVEDAVAQTTAQLSRNLMVRAILIISRSGCSISVMSSFRPAAPVLGISTDERLSRSQCLLWGVIPVTADEAECEHPQELIRRLAGELGLAQADQRVLLVGGFSADAKTNNPSVTVVTV